MTTDNLYKVYWQPWVRMFGRTTEKQKNVRIRHQLVALSDSNMLIGFVNRVLNLTCRSLNSNYIIMHSLLILILISIYFIFPFEGEDILSYSDHRVAADISSYVFNNLDLKSGQQYFCNVRVYNMAGLHSTQSSDGFVVDTVPPTIGIVYDGTGGYAFFVTLLLSNFSFLLVLLRLVM